MKKRGRPSYSKVRNNIAEILFIVGELTAYDTYKHYIQLFGKTSRRNIYYQLQKGEEQGVFVITKVEEEKGEYSWGGVSRKKYYALGKQAKVTLRADVKNYFDTIKKGK